MPCRTKASPSDYWNKVKKYPIATPPPKIGQALIESLPEGVDSKTIRLCSLRKGNGSLGRPRYVAVGYWRGGHVLREAKALVPSAWNWANGNKQSRESRLLDAANGRYRAPDPLLHVRHKFIFRRIAGDAEKIELGKKAGAEIHLSLCRPWDSTSRRSMRRACAAPTRSGKISRSGRAAG